MNITAHQLSVLIEILTNELFETSRRLELDLNLAPDSKRIEQYRKRIYELGGIKDKLSIELTYKQNG